MMQAQDAATSLLKEITERRAPRALTNDGNGFAHG
jgi:hypothetical protein